MIAILQEALGVDLGKSSFENIDEYFIIQEDVKFEDVVAIIKEAIIEEESDFKALNARGTERWKAVKSKFSKDVAAAKAKAKLPKGATPKEVKAAKAQLAKDLRAAIRSRDAGFKAANSWITKGNKLANLSKKGVIDKAKLLWMKTKNPKLKAAGLAVGAVGVAGAGTYAAMKAKKANQAAA